MAVWQRVMGVRRRNSAFISPPRVPKNIHQLSNIARTDEAGRTKESAIMNGRSLACLLLGCIAAVSLGGCASGVKTYPTVHTARMNGPQTQDSAWVAKGQTLTVKLPTTGGASYAWRLTPESASNGLVTLEQRRAKQAEQGGLALPGQPAWDIFTFQARHTGDVMLQFVYDNAWGAKANDAQQFALDVAVSKPDKSGNAMAGVDTN